MAFWRFGKETASVETISRVVAAKAADGVEVRGKLMLRFAEPQTQTAADSAIEAHAAAAVAVLEATATGEAALALEGGLAPWVRARAPRGAVRTVEVEALHVVGVVGAARKRSTSSASWTRFGLPTMPARHPSTPPLSSRTPDAMPSSVRPVSTRPTVRTDPHGVLAGRPPGAQTQPAGVPSAAPRSSPPSTRSPSSLAPSTLPPIALRSSTLPPTSRLSMPPLPRRETPAPGPVAASSPPGEAVSRVRHVATLPSMRRVSQPSMPATPPPRVVIERAATLLPPAEASTGSDAAAPVTSRMVGAPTNDLASMAKGLRTSGSTVPPPATTSSPPRTHRSSSPPESSHRALSIQGEVPVALGASPHAVGAALAPLVRDSAARLLLACLRAHDLVHVQRLPGRSATTGLLASFEDADGMPVGGYEAQLASDRPGWQSLLGSRALAAVEREASLAAAYLAYATLLSAQVTQSIAVRVLESLAAAAFPREKLEGDLGRYLYSLEPRLDAELARNIADILAPHEEPAALADVLAPLVTRVQEDFDLAAAHVKMAMGG